MSLTVEKCLQAWTNSLKQLNAKADIVFFGDSLTYYGDFSSVFPDKEVCNLGLRGDTIQGMIDRVVQVKLLEPKVIYLMAGVNDIASCDLRIFNERYDGLVHAIIEMIGSNLIIQNLLPVNNRLFNISCNNDQIIAANNIIASISNKNRVGYLDIYSLYVCNGELPQGITRDGLHLRSDAYQRWYEFLKKNCLY